MPDQADITVDRFARSRFLPTFRGRRFEFHRQGLKTFILPAMGAKGLAEVTPQDVGIIVNSSRLTERESQSVLNTLKAMFALAAQQGLISASPCDGARPGAPKSTRERRPLRLVEGGHRHLGEIDANRLTEALKADSRRVQARVLLFIMLTGAMGKEATAAKWANFDPERKTLLTTSDRVNPRPRAIYLSDSAVTLLTSQERHPDSPWLFASKIKWTMPVSWPTINSYFQDTMAKLGLDGYAVPDLRSTYAYFLCRRNVPLATVRKIMGPGFSKFTPWPEQPGPATGGGAL